MHQPQVLSRALNTHNYRKDVTEVGGVRERNPSSILGRAQDSLFSSKTGLRRLFGVGKEDVVGPIPDDAVETVEIHEPIRNPVNNNALSAEETATLVGKLRRSSMTTYTINLGATGTQVQREVRRLAGLMPNAMPNAFGRPAGQEAPLHATSFDAVEEMGGTSSAPAGGHKASEDSDDDDAYAFQGGGGGAAARQPSVVPPSRGPAVKTAFSNGSGSSPFETAAGPTFGRGSYADDVVGVYSTGPSVSSAAGGGGGPGMGAGPGGRGSLELMDVVSNHGSASNLYLPAGALEPRGVAVPPSRVGKASSSTQLLPSPININVGSPVLGPGSAGAATTATTGSSQLGLMKDRKTRRDTVDGCNSSPAAVSPGTPLGGSGNLASSVVGGGSGGALASAGTSPTSVLRLPTLPPTQQTARAASNSQIGRVASFGSNADSRPCSSRTPLRASVDQRGALDPAGALDGSGGGPAGTGNSLTNFVLGVAASSGAGSGGARANSGGGRWFQQDAEDMDYMLAGNEDVLQRLFAGGGGLGQGYRTAGDSDSGGPGGFVLPRLNTAEQPVDRATEKLQELRRVQASVDDQLARERQAIAQGRVRRASVLEDVAGHQQPRWQIAYNPDAPVTHAKLGAVDPTRRSELDRAHLAKIAKDQKPPGTAAAAVSPVVARARRLSTVVVA